MTLLLFITVAFHAPLRNNKTNDFSAFHLNLEAKRLQVFAPVASWNTSTDPP